MARPKRRAGRGLSDTSAPAAAPAIETPAWAVGESGVFIGLRQREDLNGQRARVVALDAATGRVVAETASERVKVRPENLARPAPPSSFEDELEAPSVLWVRARAAKRRGEHAAALRLAFEAAQIHATYGTNNPRLCFQPEDEEAGEAAAMDWLLDGSAGGEEELLPMLDEVNRKLRLDPQSRMAQMNATDAGRQNWAATKECSPLLHAMMAGQELSDGEIERLLGEEEARRSSDEDSPAPHARAPAARRTERCAPDPRGFASRPRFTPAQPRVQFADGESSALEWAFTCSIPPLARLTTRGDRMGKGTSPAVQWCYTAFHICHHYERGIARFQIEDDDETEALLLEVLGVRECPPDLGLEPEMYETPFEQRRLGPVPLLLVRYAHHTKVGLAAEDLDVAGRFLHRAESMAKIRAASSAEVRYGKAALDVHRRLAPDGFADSALYPPRRADVERSLAQLDKQLLSVCALCGAAASLQCGRCKTAMYCCRAHQRQHWKESHRALCGGSAETARASIVFEPGAEPAIPGGMHMINVSANRGTVSSAPPPKNVHGDREFVVKLQPPLEGGSHPWMCYDEQRSFRCFVPADTPGLSATRALLEREGKVHASFVGGVGLKGYFSARWEGSTVRVFTDAPVPDPSW